jgi:hypothetical protein
MPRNLRFSVVLLSALAICVASGDPGTVSAKTTRTAVAGFALEPDFFGYEARQDRAGGWHFRLGIVWKDFSLQGDGVGIQGTLTSEMKGRTDQDFNGVLSGTFVARDWDDQVVWKGRLHGSLVGLMVTAVVTARGQGPFDGMLLQLVMVENYPPDPERDEFDLTGWVLDVGQ